MVDIKNKLYRLPQQGKIFGVCAGLAEYFDIDVTLMRVIFVVLTFLTGGAMIFLYIALAIIIPPLDVYESSKTAKAKSNSGTLEERFEYLGRDLRSNNVVSKSRNVIGSALIIIGAWLLLGQFFPQIFKIRWEFVWPASLIVLGILIIIRRGYGRK